MKMYKLKKARCISLMVLILGILSYFLISNFGIGDFIISKAEMIKQKEMAYIFGKPETKDDIYTGVHPEYPGHNIDFDDSEGRLPGNIPQADGGMLSNGQQYPTGINAVDNMIAIAELNNTLEQLREQVERDSYRHKKLGFYYIFDFDYTINSLKQLNEDIEAAARAQKIPKSLLTAVLFREMMFLGQEDMLDGLPVIGGKSIGISQIGVDNARYNESVVHGSESVIIQKSDEELKKLLRDPEKAVYFCAVQLRARAIKLTQDPEIDLNMLDKKQLHAVLEGYNQSNISFNLGPIKSKEKYAEETYRYYELFQSIQ